MSPDPGEMTVLYNYSSISVAMSTYRVDVSIAQVIMGNEVLLKCDIPSFATDFVSVLSWVDSEGFTLTHNSLGNHLTSISLAKYRFRKKIQANSYETFLLLFSSQ